MLLFLKLGSFNIFIDIVKVKNFTKPSNYKILLFFCTLKKPWIGNQVKLS